MFDRLVRAGLILIALCVAPSVVSAQAQDHTAQIEALRAKVAALQPEIVQLHKVDSLRTDSINRYYAKLHSQPVDSTPVGPFKFLGYRDELQREASAARRAWANVQPMFQGAEQDARGVALIATESQLRKDLGNHATPTTQVVTLMSDNKELWVGSFETAMLTVLAKRLPPSVQAWLKPGGIGLDDPTYTFRALTLNAREDSTNIRHTGCLNHDVQLCKEQLGLGPGVQQPEIRQLIRGQFFSYTMRHAPAGAIAAATGDTANVVTALEHLGGTSIDTLVSRWAYHVTADANHGFEKPLASITATLFWLAVFCGMAMRSTRWRLG